MQNYCRCVNGLSRSVELLRVESVSWSNTPALVKVGDEAGPQEMLQIEVNYKTGPLGSGEFLMQNFR